MNKELIVLDIKTKLIILEGTLRKYRSVRFRGYIEAKNQLADIFKLLDKLYEPKKDNGNGNDT